MSTYRVSEEHAATHQHAGRAKCRVQYQDDPTPGGLLESEVDELRSAFQGPAAMMWGLDLLGGDDIVRTMDTRTFVTTTTTTTN